MQGTFKPLDDLSSNQTSHPCANQLRQKPAPHAELAEEGHSACAPLYRHLSEMNISTNLCWQWTHENWD
jgi:hypothetical protein